LNIRSPKFDLSTEPPAVAKGVPPADPLSDSLLFLAAYHGRALSRGALLAGLPVERGALSAALYERAAQRAGLEAQLVERRL
jgi:ATP-binding cassette, subfamily C, bacterial LapB